MSFVMFIEAMVPISGSALFTSVYNLTIEVFPGGVFLVSTALAVFASVCIMYVFSFMVYFIIM